MDDDFRLETKHTYMRPITIADAESAYLLNLDPEVIRYTGDVAFSSIDEAENFLSAYDQYKKYDVGRLAVIDKTSNEFLGWCGLKFDEEVNEYDIGFRFFRRYWNQGFATETAYANLQFGFEMGKIETIVGRVMKENIASIKVLEKIGLKLVSEKKFDAHDGLLFQLSKKDFFPKIR